jgi:hypothetical protein
MELLLTVAIEFIGLAYLGKVTCGAEYLFTVLKSLFVAVNSFVI